MKKYFRIWSILTIASLQNNFSSRFGASILIFGKIVRFFFFFFFLYLIGSKVSRIGGYTLDQMILFFLTYQLVDTLPQFFFRSVYRFRRYVTTGDFDYFLIKPLSPLFRSLLGEADPLDIPMIILSIVFILLFINKVFLTVTIYNLFLYVILIINALFISLAFHIGVLSLGIVTTEIDNAIMFYRDVTQMGRIPVNIYKQPINSFLTFVIPVGIMMTFPAKALLGLLSLNFIFLSFIISFIFLSVSLFFWRQALKFYSSASS